MHFLSSRRHVLALLSAATLLFSFTSSAAAIVLGSSSGLGAHVVRVIGGGGRLNCSGVVLDKMHVATAAHCGPRGVMIDGVNIFAVRITQNAKLEDGRTVSVRGDALILGFREPLPASASPISIGEQGSEGSFTIAGFGATAEAQRGTLGNLHEASVVHHKPWLLVDPRRDSELSASACYGDSGGAVIRNGALVGVITRASHPHPSKVCGHLTHYTPIVATAAAPLPAVNSGDTTNAQQQVQPQRRYYRRAVTAR
jgi:Trypsin